MDGWQGVERSRLHDDIYLFIYASFSRIPCICMYVYVASTLIMNINNANGNSMVTCIIEHVILYYTLAKANKGLLTFSNQGS